MKNGVPFDVAMCLPTLDRSAWSVIFGQFEGQTFNFRHGEWEKP